MLEFGKAKLISVFGGSAGAIVAAMIGYTDIKYESTKEYVDLKHDQVSTRLEDIKELLIKIDQRLYEINREGRK